MRHRSGQRKLNITDGAHRVAMLRNISNSLIEHEQIKTTLIRAKELRRFIEPLITLGKRPTVANRRLAFSRLRDRDSVTKLFDDLGKRFAGRPGGYVRILKNGFRVGDSAPMAVVELVERREEASADEPAAKTARREDPVSAPAAEEAAAAETAEAEESGTAETAADRDSGDK